MPQALSYVRKNVDYLCLATDGWDAEDKSYWIAVEVFYITAEWKFERQLLGLRSAPGARSNVEAYSFVIRSILADLELSCPVYSLTADTTATMPATARFLDVTYVPCLIHEGNLVFTHAVEKVSWLKYLLDKLSAGTNWVLQKKIAKRLFLDLQADNPKKPVTNWRLGASQDSIRKAGPKISWIFREVRAYGKIFGIASPLSISSPLFNQKDFQC